MFKNTIENTTTLVESHRSQKSPLKAPFQKNKLYGLSFYGGAFLRFVGAPNESLRLIIIILEKNNFTRVTSDPKKSVKGSISAKLVIRT